jgi:hypothetical protein
VGTVNKGTDGLWLRIDDFIPDLDFEERNGAPSLARCALPKIGAVVDGKGRETRVLGWYHTHPNMHLALSPEDEKLAESCFHYPWHVTYIIDPINKDWNFFSWKEGALTPRAGFRVYGKKDVIKEQQRMEEKSPPRTEDPMRDRFFERHFEQLRKLVKEPPPQRHHRVIIAMIAVVILLQLLLLMRGAGAPGTISPDIQKRLDRIDARIDLMNRKLAQIAPSAEAPAPAEEPATAQTPTVAPSPAATPAAAPASPGPAATSPWPGATPPAETPGQSPSPAASATADGASPAAPDATASPAAKPAVRIHKVQKDETLSTICKKYYNTTDPGIIKWLSHINNLQKPEKLAMGDELRIPPLPEHRKKRR